MSDEEEVPNDFQVNIMTFLTAEQVAERLDQLNGTKGIMKFLKLVRSLDLYVQFHGTIVEVPDELYAESNAANRGKVKKAGFVREAIFITCVSDNYDFAVTTTWFDLALDNAFIGGPRSGHRPAKHYTQSTKLMEEIKRCLTD